MDFFEKNESDLVLSTVEHSKYVRAISLSEMKILVKSFHYLGEKPFRASYCFGLFVNEQLIGGIAFHGISAPETAVGAFGLPRNDQKGIWEIGRLVIMPEFNGKNYGSYFISKSINLLRKQTSVRAIITYAESPRHNGGIYRAANFTYCGLTNQKSDFYVNGKIQERGKTRGISGVWVPRPLKHRFVKIFDPSLQLKWKEVRK